MIAVENRLALITPTREKCGSCNNIRHERPTSPPTSNQEEASRSAANALKTRTTCGYQLLRHSDDTVGQRNLSGSAGNTPSYRRESLYLFRVEFDQEILCIRSFQCFPISIQGQPFGAFNIHLDHGGHSEAENVEVEYWWKPCSWAMHYGYGQIRKRDLRAVSKARLVEGSGTRSVRYSHSYQADVCHPVKLNIFLKPACEQS